MWARKFAKSLLTHQKRQNKAVKNCIKSTHQLCLGWEDRRRGEKKKLAPFGYTWPGRDLINGPALHHHVLEESESEWSVCANALCHPRPHHTTAFLATTNEPKRKKKNLSLSVRAQKRRHWRSWQVCMNENGIKLWQPSLSESEWERVYAICTTFWLDQLQIFHFLSKPLLFTWCTTWTILCQVSTLFVDLGIDGLLVDYGRDSSGRWCRCGGLEKKWEKESLLDGALMQ